MIDGWISVHKEPGMAPDTFGQITKTKKHTKGTHLFHALIAVRNKKEFFAVTEFFATNTEAYIRRRTDFKIRPTGGTHYVVY